MQIDTYVCLDLESSLFLSIQFSTPSAKMTKMLSDALRKVVLDPSVVGFKDLDESESVYRALYDFGKREDDELDLVGGDLVRVLRRASDGILFLLFLFLFLLYISLLYNVVQSNPIGLQTDVGLEKDGASPRKPPE